MELRKKVEIFVDKMLKSDTPEDPPDERRTGKRSEFIHMHTHIQNMSKQLKGRRLTRKIQNGSVTYLNMI